MTMIERVSRAIDPKIWVASETAKSFVESAGRTWEGSHEQKLIAERLKASLTRARAAIEAMRVPTSAMEVAGDDAAPPFGDPSPKKAWAAMISAALQESEEAT